MGEAPPPVTVIVLTWNGLQVTRRCVESITGTTDHNGFEVMVVDNGSTDGTLEYLRKVEGIRLIENGRNLGFVAGNNTGIRSTANDVVLMNNDTEVIQPDWLTRMQRLARSRPDIGIVGCRLVNAEGRLVHAGTYMPTPSFWGQEYPGDELDIGQYSSDREVEGVVAACVYIKREVIDRVGPLDEDYFSYYEDTDYCLKAAEAGFRVFCCGGVTVRHLENASTDLNRMDFSATFQRSREVFISKWKGYYEGRYRHRLTWRSFLSGSSLYSRASAGFLHALDRAGVELNLGFLEGAGRAELDDFRINDMKNRPPDRERPQVVFSPPWLLDPGDGSYNIGFTFTPFDGFERDWVNRMNRMDEVWLTSEFQREVAVEGGVKVETAVVPLGMDPEYFHPGIKGYPLDARFTFLAPLEWGPSSAAETLLRAFIDEFGAGDGAVLVVMAKCPPEMSPVAPVHGTGAAAGHSAGLGGEVEQAVEAMNLPLERAPVVFIVDHEVPVYQLGCLNRSADCVVLADRSSAGEPSAARALACGVPVIRCGWGSGPVAGLEPFLEAGYRMIPAPVEGLSWAEPDYADLRSLMRRAFEEAERLKDEAARASHDLRVEISWDAAAAGIARRLETIA